MSGDLELENQRAELDRLNQLMLSALRLGFHDDVRHWREERAKLVRKMRGSTGGAAQR